MKTALSNPELTNPSQVYGGVGLESGNVSAGNWRWLRCRAEQVAEETAQGWRRAGEGRGHAVGGEVRVGKDQE